MQVYNILDFGAAGDGTANDAAAIQRAIDACTQAGGGTVFVPAGKNFRTGTIELKSNVELHVERGAVLAGSGKWADYTHRLQVGALSGGALDAGRPAQSMLITAERADNIAIMVLPLKISSKPGSSVTITASGTPSSSGMARRTPSKKIPTSTRSARGSALTITAGRVWR